LLISNVLYNTVIMRLRGLTYKQYFAVKPMVHTFGILGGAIWMTALVCNLIAAGTAGPAISYALGQGATLVGAIWGVFIWREFRGAPRAAYVILTGMFLSYAVGLLLVGIAAH
jgi:glucose uptake protein